MLLFVSFRIRQSKKNLNLSKNYVDEKSVCFILLFCFVFIFLITNLYDIQLKLKRKS